MRACECECVLGAYLARAGEVSDQKLCEEWRIMRVRKHADDCKDNEQKEQVNQTTRIYME